MQCCKAYIFFICVLCSISSGAFAKLTVASLHPIATDWLQQIGGAEVEVFAIAEHGASFNPHRFKPSAQQIRVMESSELIFAMGKKLETYLDELRDSLGSKQKIIEIGRTVPSQKVDADPIYVCCPKHTLGSIDPHWWHNVRYAARAVRVVADALSAADPEHKDIYQQRGKALAHKLRQLHRWVKAEVSTIPLEQRTLVTAHAAFAYFCKEYGFAAHYVQGLDREGEIPAQQLAVTLRQLRRQRIRAVFPEHNANPKILTQIAEEVGCNFGQSLDAEGGVHASYIIMIQHNVNSIVAALRP